MFLHANFLEIDFTNNTVNAHLELKLIFKESYKGNMNSRPRCDTFIVEEVETA